MRVPTISMLLLLDEIEDAPRYYKRKLESVRLVEVADHHPTLQSSHYTQGDILQCWCYKLDNFKGDMLHKPFITSYSAKEYPYSES